MKQTARIIRNNVPYTLLPNGTLYGEPIHAPTVAAVRLLPDPPPPAVTIGVAGSSVAGSYYWNSTSTTTDDGVSAIKLAALTTGRYLPVTVGSGGPPSGVAGGELAGTYPNPTIPTVSLNKLPKSGASDTYVLTWSDASNQWVPAPSGSSSSGTVLPGNVGQSLDTVSGPVAKWVTRSLDSYSTLRSAGVFGLTAPAQVVQVQCRSTVGDGGGGLFAYDSSDTTSTDDDGVIIVGNNGERFKRIYSGGIDAAWFGVVPSTAGVPIDVAPAMQAAIDATPVGGQLIVRACNVAGGLAYRLKSAPFTDTATGTNFALKVTKQIWIQGQGGQFVNGATVFLPDVGVGGIWVHAEIGFDGRFTHLDRLAFHGPDSGAVAHGIYSDCSVTLTHCYSSYHAGMGVFINGQGGINNCNGCSVLGLAVTRNRQHGWFITGNDSNGNNFSSINANENRGVGIWDSSFLGNNYSGCQAALNGTDALGQGSLGQPLGYKTDGGTNATVFTGCYTEDSDYHDFGGYTQWIGGREGAGQVAGGGGSYYTPGTSFQMAFRTQDLGNLTTPFFMEFTLAPGEGLSNIMRFRLPDVAQGGTRSRDFYRFGVLDPHIESVSLEGYSFTYGNSFNYQPFMMSAEAFYRGAGRMVFCNGYYHRSFTGNSSVWRYVSTLPAPSSANGSANVVGDVMQQETPVAGGFFERVCTRVGLFYEPVQRSTAYTLAARVTTDVDNGHYYQCTTAGTTAATAPAYNTGSGSTTTDGTAVFTEFGAASLWLNAAPVGADDIRMLSKDVTVGGTIALTDAESEHQRIEFTGAPVGALSVIVSTGPCVGWVRTFWNACGQTITIKAVGGDTGVAIPDGFTITVFSDGTNARISGTSLASTNRVVRANPSFVTTEYSIDLYGNLTTLSTSVKSAAWPIELPHGSTLNSITVTVIGAAGHGALPATMPQIKWRKYNAITPAGATSSATVDSSASTGAFEAAHTIVKSSIAEVIDNTTQRYAIEFDSEGGANAVAGLVVYGIVLNFTTTTVADLGAA